MFVCKYTLSWKYEFLEYTYSFFFNAANPLTPVRREKSEFYYYSLSITSELRGLASSQIKNHFCDKPENFFHNYRYNYYYNYHT